MADPKNTRGAPPREVHIEKKKTNWLAWILLALGILAALLALSRCNRHETVAAAPAPANGTTIPPVGVKHVTLPGGSPATRSSLPGSLQLVLTGASKRMVLAGTEEVYPDAACGDHLAAMIEQA